MRIVLSMGLVLALGLVLASPSRAAGGNTTTLVINTEGVLRVLPPLFHGINYAAFWDKLEGSAASQAALKAAGFKLIRFPGGEPGNWYNWSNPYSNHWTRTAPLDVWKYANNIGAGVLFQTNPTTNAANDPSGKHAAAWATYTRRQGIDTPYWEVGNEPDKDAASDRDWGKMQKYFDAFNDQAKAMHALEPRLRVFGPSGTNTWFWWALHTLDMFLSRCGDKQGTGQVDGITLHWYPTTKNDWPSVSGVAQSWPKMMEHIKSVIAEYDSRDLPVVISEVSSVTFKGGDFSLKMAPALAAADIIGEFANTGVAGYQWFCIHKATDSWGILQGDGDPTPEKPTPTYYVFPMWTRVGPNILEVANSADPAKELSAYAGKRADGSVQVLVINKTGDRRPLAVSFKGFNPAGKHLQTYTLRPREDPSSKNVFYNSTLNPAPAFLPDPAGSVCPAATYNYSLPAYSIAMLDFGP